MQIEALPFVNWIFWAALAFAVHPQHIEAFVWVSERKEVLSALFGLLSLIAYVLYADGRRADPGRSAPGEFG